MKIKTHIDYAYYGRVRYSRDIELSLEDIKNAAIEKMKKEFANEGDVVDRARVEVISISLDE